MTAPPRKFRKRPVVITAVQSSGELIETLEGTMRAYPGDWIIIGIKGERYPCKPDIFAATYEPVDAAPAPSAAQPAEPPAPDACICSQACIHYMDALSLVQRQAREIAKLERLPTDGGHTRALRAEAERDALADALDYLRGLTPEQYSTLRADAERYRHIRDYPMSPELHRIITLQQNTLWDAAIDAVRKEQQ